MENIRKLYVNEKWREFSHKIEQRDGFKCMRCGRARPDVVLQVHHEIYLKGKAPWEYSLSDCLTLCKGCHAREHLLIEPARGWYLIEINDLGGLDGVCERSGCGHEIRYQHLTYHPNWGYKCVGSTCVQHLTKGGRLLSSHIVKLYKNISKFVHGSDWKNRFTKKGRQYICCKYQYHLINIYGQAGNYSFQIAVKQKGVRWHDYGRFIPVENRRLEQVKELAYIVLKGTISSDEEEKALFRDLYRNIR